MARDSTGRSKEIVFSCLCLKDEFFFARNKDFTLSNVETSINLNGYNGDNIFKRGKNSQRKAQQI
jgi:hypothetical protein